MPIPSLSDRGWLPPGVHAATMDEVRACFGQFDESDRRPMLQKRSERYADYAREAGVAEAVIIDGSFTTAKPSPGDIDLILVLREGVALDEEVMRPDQHNALSARWVRRNYGFDLKVATGSVETQGPLIEFFAQVRGEPTARKGMVRVNL